MTRLFQPCNAVRSLDARVSVGSLVVDDYPGATLGLPHEGRGSLASWRARIAALVVDWAASMTVAALVFGRGALTGSGLISFSTLGVYFLQKTILTWLTSASFGQLLARIAVVRVTGGPIGLLRSMARAAMVCVVLPAVVVGAERRGLDDLVLGTVVVNRAEGRTA